MLADGLGRKIDMQAAHVWYSKALAAFYAVERPKKKRYAEYRIGKLYAAGLGCEQDYGCLLYTSGNNLSLDKQSKDDTKEEERNINIKQDQLDLLWHIHTNRSLPKRNLADSG